MRKLSIALMMGVLLAGGFVDEVLAQTGSLQLEPFGAQVLLFPGHSSTTGFLIKVGSSGVNPDKLLLSFADLEFTRAGGVLYAEPGTTKRSASSWLSVQPITVPGAPGDGRQVRIAIRVPADAAPGVYTSAVLVTQTPPELAQSISDGQSVPKAYCAFTILVIVRPPVPNHGVELTMIPR